MLDELGGMVEILYVIGFIFMSRYNKHAFIKTAIKMQEGLKIEHSEVKKEEAES